MTSSAPSPPPAPPIERIVLRPLASAVPLGFVGLVVATTVLACLNLGWVPLGQQHQVAIAVIAFTVPLQGVAMVLCLLSRDSVCGAAFGVQAAAWLALGVLLLRGAPGSRSVTVAVLLFAGAERLLPSVLALSLGRIVPALGVALVAVRFVVTGLFERLGGPDLSHAAGWVGVALAVVALYGAFAGDLESATNRSVLPLGRYGIGRAAHDATLPAQRAQLEHEPGVRPQL